MPRAKKTTGLHSDEPHKKPYHKVAEDKGPEVKLHHMEPPPKPSGDEETRLFQTTTKGQNEKGANVVTGTVKRWLTRQQAKDAGHHWV